MIKRGALRDSKGQYATEVLMTYGWALILISTVLGALFYFDIFSLQDIKPDVCTLTPGLVCDEVVVHPSNFSIKATNAMGEDITIIGDSITLINRNIPGQTCSQLTSDVSIENGASNTGTIQCTTDIFEPGHKQEFYLNFTYHFDIEPNEEFNAQGRIFTYVSE